MIDRTKLGAGAAIAALVATGLAARSLAKIALQKGRAGDDAPGYTARRDFGRYAVAGRSVTIRRARAELFDCWRDFTNLAAFMENLEKVDIIDASSGEAIWRIKAPGGRTVDIETRIVKEEQGKLIAWRSVEGAEIETEGRVTFQDAPGQRGTRVGLIIAYRPPAGRLGRVLAKAFLREPEIQARHDLKRFKMLMETGEIATSARQRDDVRAVKQETA